MELSRKEARLLFELGEDCRQSNLKIARKLRVSKNTVASGIARLKEGGALGGFYAIIDVGKLGYRGIRLYLKLKNCPPKKRAEIVKSLVDSPVTWWVGDIEGEFDIGIAAWAKGQFEFEQYWRRFDAEFHKYISKTSLSLYTGAYDCNFGFLEPTRPRSVGKIGEYGMETVSKNELNVLNELSNNARERTVAIASKLGLSPITVQQCMRRLRKHGILKGFRAIVNLEPLGYTFYKINFQVSDLKVRERMLSNVLGNPNVIFVDEAIGYADLEIDAAFKVHAELRAFLDDFLKLYSKSISDYNYFIYLKVHKIRHFA